MPTHSTSTAAVSKDAEAATAGFGTTFSLTGPEHGSVDSSASVLLSLKEEDDLANIRLIETTGGKNSPIPSQVEIDASPRLLWIARGELPAGAQRMYRLDRGEPTPAASTVLVDTTHPENVTIRVGDARAAVQRRSCDSAGRHRRVALAQRTHSSRLDAVPDQVVTDRFPPDHAHQSGLFLAYVKTEFEGRTPDFWNLLGGTGRVRSKGVTRTTDGPIFAEFQAVHEHVDQSASPEKVALNEIWSVRVWNIGGREAGYWICDLTSRVECATDRPLHLPQYHYGGMALRGARQWTAGIAKFTTSEGLDRIAGNHTRPWWCDLSGPAGDATAGLLFITHPDNFRAPEPLRIHPTMPYMVYTPSFLGEWDLQPGEPHVSRYRFVFHDGDLPPETANRLQRQFAAPLQAQVIDVEM
ncbi:MAG: PmoA family protein [Planctomycetaceae bacterium]